LFSYPWMIVSLFIHCEFQFLISGCISTTFNHKVFCWLLMPRNTLIPTAGVLSDSLWTGNNYREHFALKMMTDALPVWWSTLLLHSDHHTIWISSSPTRELFVVVHRIDHCGERIWTC
jgi:hypothetical protein